MSPLPPTVLVFASRDSVHVMSARALAARVGGTFIDRLSLNLEDLLLVARHKVVEPVAVIVLLGKRTVIRVPRLMTYDELLRDLADLQNPKNT